MTKLATKLLTSHGPQPEFVSVAEAAELLRVSVVSIRRYLGQKKLKRFKVGARTLLQRNDVMALVREE